MDELLGVLVRPRTQLADLLKNGPLAAFLVLDLVESVDDNEEVCLFVTRGPNELLGGEREVVGSVNDKDDNVNFVLAGKDGGRLETIPVETGSVDERNVDDTVVDERLLGRARVGDVNPNERGVVVGFADERLETLKRDPGEGRLVRAVVGLAIDGDVGLLDAGIVPRVMDGAEGGRRWLLVDRKDLPAEKGVDESRLAGVEVTGNKDLGRRVVDALLEVLEVFHLALEPTVEKVSNRCLLERHDERPDRGPRAPEVKVEVKDLEALNSGGLHLRLFLLLLLELLGFGDKRLRVLHVGERSSPLDGVPTKRSGGTVKNGSGRGSSSTRLFGDGERPPEVRGGALRVVKQPAVGVEGAEVGEELRSRVNRFREAEEARGKMPLAGPLLLVRCSSSLPLSWWRRHPSGLRANSPIPLVLIMTDGVLECETGVLLGLGHKGEPGGGLSLLHGRGRGGRLGSVDRGGCVGRGLRHDDSGEQCGSISKAG